MQQTSKRYLKILSISVVFFVTVYIISLLITLDDKKVYDSFSQVSIYIYIILSVLALSNYTFRFIRWYSFVHPMNKQISILKHWLIYIGGFALTTTPGKTGETVRSVYLSSLGIKYSQSLGAFISERLLDVVIVLFLSIFLFLFSFPKYTFWILSTTLLVIVIFLFFRSKLLARIIEKMIKHQSKSAILLFQKTISELLTNRSLLKVVPLSFLAWGIQSYGLVVIVHALGFEANQWLLMGIYNISILAGAISFIPGGIGVTEASISILLVGIGMDLPLAVLASIIVRGMTLWFAIILGLVSLFILNFMI